MHKKNYVDFARMIKTQKHQLARNIAVAEDENEFYAGAEKQLSIIIDELVTIFKNDNPTFDADKFLSACEIKEEK